MKMRQSAAEFERAFLEHTHVDRSRRREARTDAIKRTKARHREKHEQSQFRRFVTLLVVLTATVVLVCWAMFQVLAMLMS